MSRWRELRLGRRRTMPRWAVYGRVGVGAGAYWWGAGGGAGARVCLEGAPDVGVRRGDMQYVQLEAEGTSVQGEVRIRGCTRYTSGSEMRARRGQQCGV